MAVEIKVPDMGESVIDATIARWIKQEGDSVSAGEPVVELETDKINLEVGAQQAGVLEKIAHPVGDNVKVGDVLATVTPGGGAAANAPVSAGASGQTPGSETTTPSQPPAPAPSAAPLPAETGVRQGGPAQKTAAPIPYPSDQRATPVAQRMAQDMGVDLSQVPPTGAGGRVTKEDVETYLYAHDSSPQAPLPAPAQPGVAAGKTVVAGKAPGELSRPPAPAPAQPAASSNGSAVRQETARQESAARSETRVRLSRRRQTIGRRLVEAQHTAAILTTFNEVDMSKVMELRKRRREGFKERYGVDLGYMSFFVKASIGALKAFPEVNAELSVTDQSSELILKHYYDIGIAIGAEDGLVVPVVRDADRLNFAGIEKAIKDFAQKAKDNTLTLDDLRGGTFTITNGGVYGSLMSTPILNPPQVAILGMHGIKERPVVVDGAMVIRPMMYLALSYDHRVVDGREAVQFLVRIKELIEDPEALLFG